MTNPSRRLDERPEERQGGRIVVHPALRMPLHAEDEMSARSAFQRFDDRIFRTARGNPQAITRRGNGLMVAGIHV